MQVQVLSDSWIVIFNDLVITCGLRERKNFKPRLLEERWQKIVTQQESRF